MKTPFDDYPQTFAIQLPEEETEVLLKAHGDKLLRQSIEGSGPDTVVLTTPKGKVYVDGIEAAMPVIQIPTTFYMFGATVHCLIAGEASTFNFDPAVFPNLAQLEKAIAERNDIARFVLPSAIKKAIAKEAKRPKQIENPRLAWVPNTNTDRELHRSLMLLPDWSQNEQQSTRYFNGRHNTAFIYQPDEVQELLNSAPEKALRELDERFFKLRSEVTADVIDILFHYWEAKKN